MTAPVARQATPADHPLMVGYASFCHTLGLSDRALRDRLRLARRFLEVHPDLAAWTAWPLGARLADLARVRAWPLVTYAILTGRLPVDLDLLVAKDLGGFGRAAEHLWAEDFTAARAAAAQLGWAPNWTDAVLRECLALVIAWSGHAMRGLTLADLDGFTAAIDATTAATRWSRRAYRSRLHSLRQLLFELGILDRPPRWGRPGASVAERLQAVPAPGLRRVMFRYVEARATTLRPATVSSLTDALLLLGEFLGAHHPEVASLRQLERHHIEAFLAWNRIRPWRGRVARPKPVAASVVHATVLAIRNFFDDLTLWGWAERPTRQLVFPGDIPRLPRPLPRALAPDVDAALMTAVERLDDRFARCGLLVLRGAGLRLGELLDLELDSVIDYGAAGSWLRVPLGKLGTERSVPLDAVTLAALDDWAAHRGPQRALPHPRDGHPTDFLFCERGRRLAPWRLRTGLNQAIQRAGLTGPDGAPLRIVPHQLRHTYATTLANAGMSLQALMAVLGHVTPEMTLRYATLASPTLRIAYDEAIGKAKAHRQLPIATTASPAPPAPAKVEWLASEFLKTRVAHGYCSLHLAGEACPYANICEQCDNFMPAPEFIPALQAQLADIIQLRNDAERRGWASEVERHSRVIARLEQHLTRLAANLDLRDLLDPPTVAG
jgi:site-specific recombinase XerD